MIKTVYTIVLFSLVMSMTSCLVKHEENNQDNTPDPKLNSVMIKQTFDKKNEALINGDYEVLRQIIHPEATYGHSNCWIQSTYDIVNHNPEDSLQYMVIEPKDIDVNSIGSTGIVTGTGRFMGTYKLDTFDMNLCFVETYSQIGSDWMLISRQAAKVPE